MATLLLNDTKLEPVSTPLPLTKYFLRGLAVIFMVAMHLYSLTDIATDHQILSNAAVWIILGLTSAISIYHIVCYGYLRFSLMTIGLFIASLLLTIPIFYPDAKAEIAIERVVTLWFGWGLFLSLQQFVLSHQQKQGLLFLLLAGALIESILATLQLFLPALGHIHSELVFGVFKQRGLLVSFLITGFAISGYLIARQAQTNETKQNIPSLILQLSPVILLPTILALGSFLHWMVSLTCFVLLVPYLFRFADKKRFRFWCSICLIGTIIGVWGNLEIQQEKPWESIQTQISQATPLLQQSKDMLIEKPITGYGYGRFESQYLLYTAKQHQLNSNYPVGKIGQKIPENDVLLWMIEGGILAILAILIVSSLIFYKIQRAPRFTRSALVAILFPTFIQSQLIPIFELSMIHWLSFIILVYWLDRVSASYHQLPLSKLTCMGLRAFALVMPIIITFIMVFSVRTNHILTRLEQSKIIDKELLAQVDYPFYWQERYEWDQYRSLFESGISKETSDNVDAFIQYASTLVQQRPRPLVYLKLIQAYQFKNEHLKAKQVLLEAKYLFPKDSRFHQLKVLPSQLNAKTLHINP